MLTISTWLWGSKKYGPADVAKLQSAVRRHLRQPYRFIVSTSRVEGAPEEMEHATAGPATLYEIEPADRFLTEGKGCFVRLRMFDPAWQRSRGVETGDRLVCIDLDTVITGGLDQLFDRPEPFVIMQGGNYANPCPYGGALIMLRGGAHQEVWSDFSLEAAGKVPFHEFPDDQGWLYAKVPGAPGWKCGPSSGVYVFRKPPWPKDDHLPPDARVVTFNGWRSPSGFQSLPWVSKHWR